MPSLSSIVAQTLQRRITGGEFRQGDCLPPQRELAESLGVSRTALREAISLLEGLGLVKSQAGRGVFVTAGAEPDVSRLPAAGAGAAAMSPQALIEFRLAVEPGWTALAAQRADAGGLAALAEIQAQMLAALEGGDLVMASEWDLKFHCRIAELSGNPALMAIAEQFRGRIAHSLRLPFANFHLRQAPADEHGAILDALRAGDAAGAAHAMQMHLHSAARRVGIELTARFPGFAREAVVRESA